ncbi:MAG: right-handed parallel beta-helix repeat-containing protein [Ginsengibacter sp.]
MKYILTFIAGVLLSLFLFAQTKEVKLKDFGAVPNDAKDDAPAILSAIKSCKGKIPVTLIFEPGVYDIFGSRKDIHGNFYPSLAIDNINNLTIEGNGAEVKGHDYATLFHFTGCKNITVRNITVDWDPLPYTQGKVVQVDADYVDVEVAAPFVAKAGLHTEAILGYDPEKNRMARRFTDHYQLGFEKTTEVAAPGIMRLFTGHQDRFAGKMPSIGNYVIARHHVYGYQSFEFNQCTGVKIENITIYSNPGMGVTGEECRNINISHLRIMIRPGSGRWMSSTADATHFRACRGTITMENCLFEGMGDDATNVRSSEYLLISELLPGNKLTLKTGNKYGENPLPPRIGDKLEISSGKVPLLAYTILTVSSVAIKDSGKTLVIGFSEKIPGKVRVNDLAGDATSCPVLRIRNCTVIRNRARGFIIKTRNAIIEDCTFQDVCASGIALETDVVAWWEAIGSRDVTIRNNRFIDCRFEPEYLQGVIESHTMSQTAPAGIYQRITIASNIFLGSSANLLKLGSADGVSIINNIMDNSKEEAILLYNSRNVFISGNKFSNCKKGLTIGPGCEVATIRCEKNTGL